MTTIYYIILERHRRLLLCDPQPDLLQNKLVLVYLILRRVFKFMFALSAEIK